MYKHYLKQILQLFKENKLIGCISILGTALSICMIMVIVIIYQMNTENMTPELNRDRMLYMNEFKVEQSSMIYTNGMSSYLMVDGLSTLQTPERIAAVCHGGGGYTISLPGIKREEKGELMFTDASFWKMFNFTFVAGGGYSEEEFKSGVKCVVIDEAYALRLYESAAMAIGKRIDIDYETYTVKGVVKSVNPFFKSTYANAWLPYTTVPGFEYSAKAGWGGGYLGALSCYILAATSSDIPAIKLEVQHVLDRLNANNKDVKLMLDEPPLNHFDYMFQSDNIKTSAFKLRYILIIMLLLLVPAINLTGLTFSHMQKRQSEMGLRRAFGATKLQLLKQVLMENVIYSLLGGVVGLLLAYLSLWLFDEILLQANYQGETMLSLDMLHPLIFVYTFLFCLLFNCLSAGIPAWKVSRENIVFSIHN